MGDQVKFAADAFVLVWPKLDLDAHARKAEDREITRLAWAAWTEEKNLLDQEGV